jgi:uncharacterized cupin superfamily protein
MLFTSCENSLAPLASGPAILPVDPMAMQLAPADKDGWRPSPVPAAWSPEGDPVARSMPLTTSADGCFTSSRWDCTAGRFRVTFACDELVQILEGSVTVDDGRQAQTLRAGDVAFFPQGLTSTWTIETYVKKFAIFRSKPYGPVRRLAAKAKRLLLGLFSRAASRAA